MKDIAQIPRHARASCIYNRSSSIKKYTSSHQNPNLATKLARSSSSCVHAHAHSALYTKNPKQISIIPTATPSNTPHESSIDETLLKSFKKLQNGSDIRGIALNSRYSSSSSAICEQYPNNKHHQPTKQLFLEKTSPSPPQECFS